MVETFGNEERQLLAHILMDNSGNRITVALTNGIVATFANELARLAATVVPVEQSSEPEV